MRPQNNELLLALKDRALAATAEGVTISDPGQPDNPIIYANNGFEQITGYPVQEALGRNCRFLQGERTDPRTRDIIRRAIKKEVHCTVEILNYRKDGAPFWNRLSINPVRDETGRTTHFIGIQSDVTRRREAEDAFKLTNEQLEAANRQMKDDLRLAAQVQQSLLPVRSPVVEQARFAWRFEPCQELAGDILNIIQLDPDHIALYVLDVAGHGVPAALLSFTLSNDLNGRPDNSCLFQIDPNGRDYRLCSPRQVLERLNRNYPMDMRTGQFFTIIYGLFSISQRVLRFASAGHPPAIYQAKGRAAVPMPGKGMPIGVSAEAGYQEISLPLHDGDRVFFYTDGLTEILNEQRQWLGADGLLDAINRSGGLALDKAVELVLDRARLWSPTGQPQDDISVVALEFAPKGGQAMYYV